MGLFNSKPAWQDKNEDKALKAVAKISDQAVLADIARLSEKESVRNAAAKKLDKSILKSLISYNNISVRYAILPFLDQSSIAKIAENDPSPELKTTALRLITDQEVLERFIVSQENLHTLTVAIEKLNNMTVLANTVRKMVDIHGHQKVDSLADESIRQDVIQQYDFVPFLKIAIAKPLNVKPTMT
jgi:hypothetical protein